MAYMTASKNRNTLERDGKEFGFVTASPVYQGSMVSLDASGLAVPAGNNTPVGVSMTESAAGDTVVVRRGVFAFANSAGNDALGRADINKSCYVADACTVKKTAGTSAAPVAGIVMDVDALGVWVKF